MRKLLLFLSVMPLVYGCGGDRVTNREPTSGAMVSFTWDSASFATNRAVDVLYLDGLSGTCYLATSDIEQWAYVRTYQSLGFEIGCKGTSVMDYRAMSDEAIDADLLAALDQMEAEGIAGVKSFGIYNGFHDDRVFQIIAGRFESCRIDRTGYNEDVIDPYRLKSVEGPDLTRPLSDLTAEIDAAIAARAWIIYRNSGIPDGDGTSGPRLDSLLTYIDDTATPIVSVSDGLARRMRP